MAISQFSLYSFYILNSGLLYMDMGLFCFFFFPSKKAGIGSVQVAHLGCLFCRKGSYSSCCGTSAALNKKDPLPSYCNWWESKQDLLSTYGFYGFYMPYINLSYLKLAWVGFYLLQWKKPQLSGENVFQEEKHIPYPILHKTLHKSTQLVKRLGSRFWKLRLEAVPTQRYLGLYLKSLCLSFSSDMRKSEGISWPTPQVLLSNPQGGK